MNNFRMLFLIIFQIFLFQNILSQKTKPKMKILAIGNSIAQDSYSYVPFISSIKENIDLTIGIAYIGGASFDTHLSNFNNITKYTYYKIKPGESKWTKLTGYSLVKMIKDEEWTHITFQQASGKSFDYSTHKGLKELLSKVKSKVKVEPKYGWLFIPVRPEKYVTSSNTYSESQLEQYYTQLANVIKKVKAEYKLDFVFPVGTAIRNALTNTSPIRRIKDNDGKLCNLDNGDNLHMRAGLPKLIEAYTIAEQIIKMMNINSSIIGDKIEIDSKFDSIRKCPGGRKYGGPVSSQFREFAKKCAIAAVKTPFLKTMINPKTKN